jgi:nucleoid DNA-binding protein
MAKQANAKAGKARPATKTVMFQQIAEASSLSRKQVASVFDALTELIRKELGKKGAGVVTIPGLLKITRVIKPKTEAKMGRNPRTGEPMMIPAKPERTIAKARCLKALKEMVK